ncbi:hypothetical protein D3C85_1235960 [compost metagenome]
MVVATNALKGAKTLDAAGVLLQQAVANTACVYGLALHIRLYQPGREQEQQQSDDRHEYNPAAKQRNHHNEHQHERIIDQRHAARTAEVLPHALQRAHAVEVIVQAQPRRVLQRQTQGFAERRSANACTGPCAHARKQCRAPEAQPPTGDDGDDRPQPQCGQRASGAAGDH